MHNNRSVWRRFGKPLGRVWIARDLSVESQKIGLQVFVRTAHRVTAPQRENKKSARISDLLPSLTFTAKDGCPLQHVFGLSDLSTLRSARVKCRTELSSLLLRKGCLQ